jgi:hypothetical protein
MANVLIDIAAEFVGNKAFKQADTATEKLTKNVKKLAGAFGLAFGTAQVIAFGKASIKAAAADQKAQQQLSLALKNVGLERDAASAEGFIQRLQSEFGIVDDKLRPAYQALAIATRDTTEAQRLLNLSLDISAATGKDLSSVTAALSRGFLGNTTALSRLGVGISKADLKAKSFFEITSDLATTFEGSATAAANTFQGSIDKLGVAAANVQEIIGTGLIDALKSLGDENSVDTLADDMERAALASADFIRGLAQIGSFKVNGETRSLIGLLTTPFKRSLGAGPLGTITRIGEASRIAPKPFTTSMTISGQTQLKQQKQITKLTKEQASSQSKITKDKKLQAALDKANIALLKGEEVFDMDKIQIAAALTSQAEALGKATSSTQRLQVANDVARLNVKQSILALEDAIALKDEAAIIAATNKLNADLRVLSALTGQKVTLTSIESILAGLKPKELIDQKNLDEALAKIAEMLRLLGLANQASKAKVPTSGSLGSGIPSGDYIAPISTTGGSIGAILEYADAASARANAFADLLDMQNSADALALIEYQRSVGDMGGYSPDMNRGRGYGAGASSGNTIIVNTGVGDPNAIAEAIDNVLREAQQRGTLTAV